MASQRRHAGTVRGVAIPEEAWPLHQAKILSLYIDRDMKLDTVMQTMAAEEAFYATKHQYTLQLDKWRFWKKKSRIRSQLIQSGSSRFATASITRSPGLAHLRRPASEPSPAVRGPISDAATPINGLACNESNDIGTQNIQPTNDTERLLGRNTPVVENGVAPGAVAGAADHTSLHESQDRVHETFLYTIDEEMPDIAPPRRRQPLTPDPMLTDSSSLSATDESARSPSNDQGDTSHNTRWAMFVGADSDTDFADQTLDREDFIADFQFTPKTPPESPSCHPLHQTLPPGCTIFSPPQSIQFDPRLNVVEFSTIINIPELLASQYKLSHRDLDELQRIAELLSAARSYADAFKLSHLIFLQTSAFSETHWNSSPILAAAEVCRNATTSVTKMKMSSLVKRGISGRADFNPPTTLEACLLHSHLGNACRTSSRKDLRPAEHHCRTALDGYYKFLRSLEVKGRPAYETILVSNLVHVLADKGRRNAFFEVQATYFPNSLVAGVEVTAATEMVEDHVACMTTLNQAASSPPSVDVNKSIFSILEWCTNVLADDDFWRMFQGFDTLLQVSNKDEGEMADLDSTVLFCYLWSRWDREVCVGSHPGQTSHCAIHLIDIETICGIRPADTLAAISTIILREPYYGSRQHHHLAGRALRHCLELSETRSHSMTEELLNVHAALLRNPTPNTPRSVSNKTRSLAQDFVRHFIALHVEIRLSENAFQDARLRPVPGRASFSPSITPTMLSSPRSSWSGYRSFKSAGRRSMALLAGKSTDAVSLGGHSVRHSTSTSSFFRSSSRPSSVMSWDRMSNDVDTIMIG